MNRSILPGQRRYFAALAVAILISFAGRAQTHFSHDALFVTDLERAGNFYDKVLQLKRIPEPFHDGKHIWYQVSEHGQLHIISGAKADVPHDINIHLAFAIPDMDVFLKHLDELGVKYGDMSQKNKGPQTRPDKVKQIYLQDPDGYWIEVNDDKY